VSGGTFDPALRVLELIATRAADPERGPKIWISGADARMRVLTDRELVWVYGPRRHDLAEVGLDDAIPFGHCVLRDVAGASPSELVTIRKVDTEPPSGTTRNA
jgi:hypothetical protein